MVQVHPPSPKPRMTETPVQKPVHVAYSPIASMNYQLTINLHDGYAPLNVLIPVEYLPPSIPTLCNPMYTMFHFGVVSHSFTKEPQHDFTSLASPKGEMESPFSWNSFLKSPRSSTLCFGEPALAKLNQETELCITKYIPLCDSAVHAGTTSSVPSSPSETNRVSDCQSSLVTTPSSSRILDKPKIEVTKVLIQHGGKNGEHSYGENFIYEYFSKMHIKSTQHMSILQAFSNCVRETFNHGLSPSEVEWGDPKGEPTKHGPNYTSSGCMLMEVDWGGKLKHNYTSCGCMFMEVDWGGKLIVNSMVNWGAHETHQNEHSTTRVHWGDHDPSLNPMDKYSISEVDGEVMTQDSSFSW